MTTTKYRKIIKKIEKYAKEELIKVDCNNYEKIVSLNMLTDLDEAFIDWNEEKKKEYVISNQKVKLHYFEAIIFKIGEIEEALKKINATAQEKYDFLAYILDELIELFTGNNNYKKFVYAMFHKTILENVARNTTSFSTMKEIAKEEKWYQKANRVIYNPINKFYFSMMHHDSKKLKKEKSTQPYLEQKIFLKRMCLDVDYINELKREKRKEESQTVSAPITKSRSIKTDIPKEEHISMPIKVKQTKSNAERKNLQEQLKYYINLETFTPNFILKEADMIEVHKLINTLYSADRAVQVKRAIIVNNKNLTDNKEYQIRDLLIPENRLGLYNELYNYCYSYHGPNIQYKGIVLNYLQDINNLITEYINNEDEKLVPDYIGLIELTFLEIEEYLPYLPEEVFTGPSRI